MKRLLLFVLGIVLCVSLCAQKFPVKVVGVSDGDTFTVINRDNLQLKVRIYGIDAPEKRQAFGNKSKEYLSSLIFGNNIYIDVQSHDRYGRLISFVYTPEGEDVSLLMLSQGMAWHYTKFDSSEKYSSAELNARRKKIGLWADAQAVAPWDFRDKNSIFGPPKTKSDNE